MFLAAATLAFGVMAVVRVHGAVKRRAAGIGRRRRRRGDDDARSLRALEPEGRAAADRLHHQALFAERQPSDTKVLRRRLIQAGIFDPRAVAYFFLARTALAVGLGDRWRSSSLPMRARGTARCSGCR